jgi:hypothetical protein
MSQALRLAVEDPAFHRQRQVSRHHVEGHAFCLPFFTTTKRSLDTEKTTICHASTEYFQYKKQEFAKTTARHLHKKRGKIWTLSNILHM